MKENVLSIRICILLILFIWGYFGGFNWLTEISTSFFQGEKYDEIRLITKVIIYTGLIIIWVFAMFPLVKDSVHTFKRTYINDILSVITIVVLSVLPIVVFRSLLFNNLLQVQKIPKNSITDISVSLFSALVYAPIVEELVCRGGLTHVLKSQFKCDSKTTFLFTTVVFALLHILKLESYFWDKICCFCLYCLLGGACGYIYYKTNNILCAILVHTLWNVYVVMGNLSRYIYNVIT